MKDWSRIDRAIVLIVLLIVTLLPAIVLSAITARAAEFTTNGRYVTISGIIQKQDARKFLDAIQDRRSTPTTIVLSSNGGYIAEAAWIGQIIRMSEWETLVPRNYLCNSACPLVWLGGIRRGLDSRLGFHTAIMPPQGSGVRHEKANAFIGQYMTSMGAPQPLVDLQPKAEACCFNYVDASQAKAWGLLEPQKVLLKTDVEKEGWLIGLRHHMELQLKLNEQARTLAARP